MDSQPPKRCPLCDQTIEPDRERHECLEMQLDEALAVMEQLAERLETKTPDYDLVDRAKRLLKRLEGMRRERFLARPPVRMAEAFGAVVDRRRARALGDPYPDQIEELAAEARVGWVGNPLNKTDGFHYKPPKGFSRCPTYICSECKNPVETTPCLICAARANKPTAATRGR